MNLDKIKLLIQQLKKDSGLQFIKANTKGTKPPLPFGSYNITSSYLKGRGRGSIEYYTENDDSFAKRTQEYRIAVSFTIFAKDNDTAMEKAHQVHQWFLFLGESFIDEQDMVVSYVGNIQNRTIFLVDSYEYKYGFDIQFRVIDEQIKAVESMETINLGGM
ncbi:hypothetical protein ABEI56_05645 [Peribacillus castrilensis]|uniref:phage neck terminator protein n=1 Tax=Peribacillus castrilensis TaxID=2897690 RepID=UPI003D284EBE